jgi:hypothetical protein
MFGPTMTRLPGMGLPLIDDVGFAVAQWVKGAEPSVVKIVISSR